MKRLTLLLFSLFALIAGSLASIPAYAAGTIDFNPSSADVNDIGGCSGAAANSALCKDIKDDSNSLFGPNGILTKVAGVFALITGVISVFMIIISGLRYVTSGGDTSKTKSAKDGIMYSAIGITVALVAGSVVRFVLSKLS